MERIKRFFLSPYTVMGTVVLMYVAKAIVKISTGHHVNSPAITGDGFHNVSDIPEALFVIAAVFVSRLPPSEHYPMGRKNIESLVEVFVGVGLACVAVFTVLRGASGILSYITGIPETITALLPQHEELRIGEQYFWPVVSVIAGSVVLSLLVSTYEIKVGRLYRHHSMVADGEETRSDGRIEASVLAGVLGEYLFHAPWIEYPLAFYVAWLMLGTSREIFKKGWRAILQRSIGIEHDAAIRSLCENTHGVLGAEKIKTFMVGSVVKCILKVTTRCSAQAAANIKHALIAHIDAYLKEHDFTESEIFLRVDQPIVEYRRVAYAVQMDRIRTPLIAEATINATHYLICDIENGEVVRWTVEPAPDSLEAIGDLLIKKRVIELYIFGKTTAEETFLEARGIEIKTAPSFLPVTLGLVDP